MSEETAQLEHKLKMAGQREMALRTDNEALRTWATMYRDEMRECLKISASATPEQRAGLLHNIEQINALLR